MEFTTFQKPTCIRPTSKLSLKADVFAKLLNELRSRDLPESMIESINQQVALINAAGLVEKAFAKQLSKSQSLILKKLEQELKIVPRNHYLTLGISIGMAGLGIPLGVAFGISLWNSAFSAIGLPIGMAIGIAVGSAKDKKAASDGNQLDVVII